MLENTMENYVPDKTVEIVKIQMWEGQFNLEKNENYQRKHQFNKTFRTIDISENAHGSTRHITIKALWYLTGSLQWQHQYKKIIHFTYHQAM